jgi:hypothetical protein
MTGCDLRFILVVSYEALVESKTYFLYNLRCSQQH